MPGPHCSRSELKVLLSQHPGGEAAECACVCVCVKEFVFFKVTLGSFLLQPEGV